jgi:hypothetical protein
MVGRGTFEPFDPGGTAGAGCPVSKRDTKMAHPKSASWLSKKNTIKLIEVGWLP